MPACKPYFLYSPSVTTEGLQGDPKDCSVWVAGTLLFQTKVKLTFLPVAYLGMREQLTDAGSSLESQSGNPP